MASSRKKAETTSGAATRADRLASRPGASTSGRKAAAPRASAAKKKVKKAAAPKRSALRKKPTTAATRAARATKKPERAKPAKTTRARKPPASAAEPKAAPRRRAATSAVTRAVETNGAVAPHAVEGLNEEDQIRAAKYLPRELPKRVFEEERFIFPETYGVNRIRLLVRDPEWIFAYWDVSPAAMKDFAKSIGERALALSRLTLRVIDPVSGGSTDILLPPGARWWYVRTDQSRRTYRAELGVTLPSGDFRRLAESNTVVTPRVGPSSERARRRLSYPDARDLPLSAAEAASEAEKRTGVALEPWAPGAVEGAETPASVAAKAAKGGASDAFRPGGASDAFPGASDTFRR